MPHSKSAKKRVRQSIKRQLHNKAIRSAIRTQRKKFLATVAAGDAGAAAAEFRKTVRAYKKAAAKGVIHTNAASRTESRLAQKLNALKAPAAASAAP